MLHRLMVRLWLWDMEFPLIMCTIISLMIAFFFWLIPSMSHQPTHQGIVALALALFMTFLVPGVIWYLQCVSFGDKLVKLQFKVSFINNRGYVMFTDRGFWRWASTHYTIGEAENKIKKIAKRITSHKQTTDYRETYPLYEHKIVK